MADNADKSDPGLPVSCECGYIKMRTPFSKPLGTAHCHCTTCRKQSASAFGTSVFFLSKDVFPLATDVETKLSVYTHPTESGNTAHCYFCPRCGVRILHAALLPDGTMRERVSFKGGAIDDGAIDWKALNTKHIYTRSAIIKLPEEWECYEKMPPKLY
ncbi:Mss4-like protein [Apodospora peruviana]|uniref:Mss4-like protein n=1 Tax=Apodospora peruviana TaxID=516989 RepID=A0AAE0M481_9PEZI|nr:Mss4-like protein [Apodospora peruviana]